MNDLSNSSSLINNNSFKKVFKLLKKTKVCLETELEKVKRERDTYKNELNEMKQLVSDLRFQHSQSNEQSLKLEIGSLKQESNKKKEIELMNQEKQSMLNKISSYEENINELNYNNKIFREQTDIRFSQYQKEIETLRNNLNQEKINKDKIISEKIKNIII